MTRPTAAVVGLRRRRADRRLPAAAPLRRHAVRGRRPARRARAHPRAAHGRRRHASTSTPASSCTTARTYPNLLRLFGELGRGDAGVGHVDERALRGLRAGVRGRPRARRPVPAGVQPGPARLPADARRGACASTGTPAACWPTSARATSRSARSWPSAATRATSSSTSCCRSSRAVWSAGETVSLAYPARYLFTFLRPPRDARRRRLAALAHGRRRVAALRRARGQGALRGARVDPGAGGHAHRRGVEIRDDADDRAPRFDVAVVATHPDQALALLAAPTAAERAVLGAFALLAQRHPAAPRHLGAAARPRRAGVVELPQADLRRSATRRCSSATT